MDKYDQVAASLEVSIYILGMVAGFFISTNSWIYIIPLLCTIGCLFLFFRLRDYARDVKVVTNDFDFMEELKAQMKQYESRGFVIESGKRVNEHGQEITGIIISPVNYKGVVREEPRE